MTQPLAPSIRGIQYPLTVRDGNLATSTDYDLVAQQIRSVIETRFYERVMRASYGTDDFIFSILDPGQINSSIQQSIQQNVSGLTSLNVIGDWGQGDDGLYRVMIEYAVDGVPQPPIQYTLSN